MLIVFINNLSIEFNYELKNPHYGYPNLEENENVRNLNNKNRHYWVAFVTWILISLIKMKEIIINIDLLCNKLKGKRRLISSYNKPINGLTNSRTDTGRFGIALVWNFASTISSFQQPSGERRRTFRSDQYHFSSLIWSGTSSTCWNRSCGPFQFSWEYMVRATPEAYRNVRALFILIL